MADRNLILFVGNPGKGKSTLLNALIGSAAFKSDVAYGTGLTAHFQQHTHTTGVVYCDTPGLDDVDKRQKAATEIELALKQNGKYRIVFVVTLEEGRCRPADGETMTTVLNAIQIPKEQLHFGVIINKLPPRQMSDLSANNFDNPHFKKVAAGLFTGDRVTDHIHLQPKVPQLEEAENAVLVPPPPELVDFINNLPPVQVASQQVNALNVDKWEARILALEKLIAELNANNQRLEQRCKQLMEELARKPPPPPPPVIIHRGGGGGGGGRRCTIL